MQHHILVIMVQILFLHLQILKMLLEQKAVVEEVQEVLIILMVKVQMVVVAVVVELVVPGLVVL